ncbi:MAG TPA: hypothetical protein VNU01_10255 [Egibacteraceae bacterium]|nr:hypothetical protein [Egibacteraceae bacterium]
MSGFEDKLRERLESNAALAEQRAAAEAEMDRAALQAQQEAAAAERELRASRDARHAELAARLEDLLDMLRGSGQRLEVRAGWSASGEEFYARLATHAGWPQRVLSLELDRDDDEVLARWHSDVGNTLELWRLLEFDVEMLEELVLQVIDDELWRGASAPPAFPEPA